MVNPPKWKFEHQTIVLLAMLVGAAAGVVVGFATSHETAVIFGLAYREDFRCRRTAMRQLSNNARGVRQAQQVGIDWEGGPTLLHLEQC